MKKKYEEVTIGSNLQNLIYVQNFIEEMCGRYNIQNHFGLLSVAITEAVENAIKHGNLSDESKKVSVKACKCQGGISFRVTDEGKGFNPEPYQELSDESGKGDGIFLMRSLSNKLNFFDEGKTVELTFHIDGIDSSKALERGTLMTKYLTKEGAFAKERQKV